MDWYKSQSRQHFQDWINHWSQVMGVEQRQCSIVKTRDYKRRWGCYDGKQTITFNWRLVMAPSQVAKYVVIHELAHCFEFNHSKRFWNIVEQYEPDWRSHRDWLYQNSLKLYRI